jgi:hypothetical protein
MKTYNVKTRFVFEGTFAVRTQNAKEARRIIKKSCFMNMRSGIHCDPTVSEVRKDNLDWDFDVHAEQKILSVEPIKRQ